VRVGRGRRRFRRVVIIGAARQLTGAGKRRPFILAARAPAAGAVPREDAQAGRLGAISDNIIQMPVPSQSGRERGNTTAQRPKKRRANGLPMIVRAA
jgi:hypothetical protein